MKETDLPEVFWKPMFTKRDPDNLYKDIIVKDSIAKEEEETNENVLLESISTGIRLPEKFWKERYESVTPTAREQNWGGTEFWDKGLLKVIKNANGDWEVLYPNENHIMVCFLDWD